MGKDTLVINLIAGPSAGKTTCAWEIAESLKKEGYVVEYVSEYAKELIWDEKWELLDGSLDSQRIIMKEQKHRIDRLLGKVDFIVTDRPLIMDSVYLANSAEKQQYESEVIEISKKYNNFNLFIERGNVFEQEGRIHDLEQSIKIDETLINMLNSNNIVYEKYTHEEISNAIDKIKNAHEHNEVIKDYILENYEVTYSPTSMLPNGWQWKRVVNLEGEGDGRYNDFLIDPTGKETHFHSYPKYIPEESDFNPDVVRLKSEKSMLNMLNQEITNENEAEISIHESTKNTSENMTKTLQKLNDDLESFLLSENDYKSALVDLGKFGKYSLNNKLLLLNQMKERGIHHLSPVFKTYSDWNKENVSVKRGARAFEIIIPNKVQRYKDDDNVWKTITSSNRKDIIQSGKEIKSFTFFNVKNVAFHICDTNSTQNIIHPGQNNRLTIDISNEEDFEMKYKSALDSFSKKYNITEDSNMNPDLGGFAKKSEITNDYQIVINGQSSSSMKLRTLFHEVAHVELGHLDDRISIDTNLKEVEAESTAFLFAEKFGIDTSISMYYLNSFKNGEDISGVFDKVLVTAQRIKDEFLESIIDNINDRDVNQNQVADINEEDIFSPAANMELF